MQTEQAIREQLRTLAVNKFGPNIKPICDYKSLDDCYSLFDGHTALWFNTPDGSSHIVLSKELSISQKG
ncbi:MAG TPA: hypothetical protein VHO70_19900 [Chitinispirillaceae bacterium]|nr:hypothetical protein [Chitinispirillaceae bacterium]